jgi:hypothetical protein
MRFDDDMGPMIDSLADLTLQQRETLKERYRFLLREYRRRSWIYAWMFYVFRITMTVGSLAVPALLSIKTYTDNASDIETPLYWFTWALSLAVTTSNGMITLFRLDKRYFSIYATTERLRSEMWQYLSLSGRYSGHFGGMRPTHKNQYVYFFSKLEKIRMKHVSDEYLRSPISAEDKVGSNSNASIGPGSPATALSASSQHVPTPPDPANLGQTRPQIPTGPIRRESTSTVGTDDTAIEMPVHGEAGTAVPTPSGTAQPLLPTAPKV